MKQQFSLLGITFLNSYAFLIVPIFFLLLAYTQKKKDPVLVLPEFDYFSSIPKKGLLKFRKVILFTLFLTFFLFLVISAARPIKIEKYVDEQSRRNIILCLDVSRSTEMQDFIVGNFVSDRLSAIKQVVKDFVKERPLDRIGLVVFGSKAFLQVPLTTDRDIVLDFVSNLSPGMAGPGTAIGDGLGLSIKRIKELPSKSKAIILVTDGASNSGGLNAIEAARIASALKIKIYTIGVGSKQSKDYDEKTLTTIANKTKAKFFFASDIQSLSKIYSEINTLEQSKQKNKLKYIYHDFSWYPLVTSLLFLFLLVVTRTTLLNIA
jgi:Ca-activated chloride channel homolog